MAALSSEWETMWTMTLLAGFIVIIAVIALLTVLMIIVRQIDTGVKSLWTVTKRVAQNTTGLYQLAGTASILRALREEALRHDKLLSEQTEKKAA